MQNLEASAAVDRTSRNSKASHLPQELLVRVQAVVDVVQEDMFDLAQRVQHGLGIATVVEVALEGAFELLQLRDLIGVCL
jgi:hypothetical protein